jgi:hypothetical protein
VNQEVTTGSASDELALRKRARKPNNRWPGEPVWFRFNREEVAAVMVQKSEKVRRSVRRYGLCFAFTFTASFCEEFDSA